MKSLVRSVGNQTRPTYLIKNAIYSRLRAFVRHEDVGGNNYRIYLAVAHQANDHCLEWDLSLCGCIEEDLLPLIG